MFFADKGDFAIEQIRDLYQIRPAGELPTIICILNKGVIVNVVSQTRKNSRQKRESAEQEIPTRSV
jgi:hypothetical protein